MKRKKTNVKRTILKKIEIKNGIDVSDTSTKRYNKMSNSNDRVKARIQKSEFKPRVPVSLADRNKLKLFVPPKKKKKKITTYDIQDYGNYIKKENVDYDTIIYISSYNRFDKIYKILESLYSQSTKYSFTVIFMDDGSTDKRYLSLPKIFPHVIYLKNEENGGKEFYWRTTNKIWEEAKKYKTHTLIQIDDDFILCDKFIDSIMDLFFNLKLENNSYMGIRYHFGHKDAEFEFEEDFWDRSKYFHGFDGGSVFDTQFMEMFDYKMDAIDPAVFKEVGAHSHVWSTLNEFLIKFGVLVYKTKKSLAWHDGNFDSKMHPEIRKTRKVHTKNFSEDGNIGDEL